MNEETTLHVDLYTCNKYGISADAYISRLKELDIFKNSIVLPDHTNANIKGDFSRGGAITRISFEGNPGDEEEMYKQAKIVFDELRMALPKS